MNVIPLGEQGGYTINISQFIYTFMMSSQQSTAIAVDVLHSNFQAATFLVHYFNNILA